MWDTLLRPLLFLLDAEFAHRFSMGVFILIARVPGVRLLLRSWLAQPDARLHTELWGLPFPSPIGLAAGFDKEASWYEELGALGFGFVEVGTLTGEPQPGNPRPRLFRLPADQALLNRFGFNNRGSEAASRALSLRPARDVLVGVNIGKTKVVDNEKAVDDYLASFRRLWPHARYFVVNVSSPNTPGLRQLQDREPLGRLLRALRNENLRLAAGLRPLPILLKIAPDLTDEQLDDIVDLCLEVGIAGLVATNTTISREGLLTEQVEQLGAGGVSGKPLTERSRRVVARLYRRLAGRLPIIGVGGVMTGADAWELLRAGASLVQVYTGFIYGGPTFAADLNRYIAEQLAARGLSSVKAVVGEAAPEYAGD